MAREASTPEPLRAALRGRVSARERVPPALAIRGIEHYTALMTQSLQDTYGPTTRCFGCGPANEHGLQIKSRVQGSEVVADWKGSDHHEAFEGVLNGGIIGTLLDCHSNWTAAWTLMTERKLEAPPPCVTAEFHVRLRAPTPSRQTIHLRAHAVDVQGDKVVVEASIEADGKVTATCRGVFVAVREGHPAFHRW